MLKKLNFLYGKNLLFTNEKQINDVLTFAGIIGMIVVAVISIIDSEATDLISAIPLLVFHSVLQTKTTEIIDSMEMAGVKCLNALIARHDLNTQSRATDNDQ